MSIHSALFCLPLTSSDLTSLHRSAWDLQGAVRRLFTVKVTPLATFAELTRLPEDILSEGILPYLLADDSVVARRAVKCEITRQLQLSEIVSKCASAWRG
ncbi:hypothetical protein TrRE_jg837 [Triparma retinervis]|uniref:Uncharacterized protein n=1 Tax=Triparma retinervis TaxID=2557542 RepID=A0A9W7KU88_9STRA|nr:hypothetical protein TrRE_jg837 [Triparma retinervis]